MRLSASELSRFGEDLGRQLRAPAVIGLSGELGTGKTTLVQAICRGLGAGARATSPTYALVHHYDAGPVSVYHVDCYRLRQPDEARDLGFDDMLREREREGGDGVGGGGGGAIILIEWPERAGAWAPPLDRHFRLSYDSDPGRRVVEE
jgi:tRNA threonylcarbamoyladenosine biosynthesis protein TsaE